MGSVHAEQLEGLVRSGTVASDPQVKIVLSRLNQELKQRLAAAAPESLDVFSNAQSALAKLRGAAHIDLRFDCAYDCAQYFYVGGHVSLALAASANLKALATQTGDKRLRRKAHGFAGIAHMDVGDMAQAMMDYAAALSLAEEIGDREAQCRTLMNIGVALEEGGLYRESLVMSNRAVLMATTTPGLQHLIGTAKTNVALAHYHLGEWQSGLVAIKEAIASDPEPRGAIESLKRAVRESIYVGLALELGYMREARERARFCGIYGRLTNSRRGQVLADVANGQCEVYGGDVNRGLKLLEDAALVDDIGTWAQAEALEALVKAYDAVGDVSRALEHLQTLLGFLKGARQKSIAALLSVVKPNESSPVVIDGGNMQTLALREANLRTKLAVQEIESTRLEMFERLAAAADVKEEESGEHGYRVGKLCALMGERLAWSFEACNAIDMAARLHDIGKTAIPDRILLSTANLDEAQRHFMCSHTTIGAELLGKSNIPQLRMAEEIARHHHEWWNGEGYPSKLKGKRIPIHARIVALADVFDALTHGRPFSAPWPIDKALEEIRARKGTQFDPELTDLFLELIDRLRKEHQDLDEYLGRAGKASPFLQARNRIRQMLAEEREHEKMATVEGNQTRH